MRTKQINKLVGKKEI